MKHRFDINKAIRLVREAVRPFPRAALFELYDEGFTSVFELLCAVIISIRTLDGLFVYNQFSRLSASVLWRPHLARKFFSRARAA
jgi:hypothetical protein